MNKNMKGFTLIELLAVIVILAVIALIATPIIMGVINDSKKGADRDAAYGIIKAVETASAQKMVADTTFVPANCATASISGGTITCGTLKAEIKGTAPKSADIRFDEKGVADGTVIQMGSGYFKLVDGKFGEPTAAKPA